MPISDFWYKQGRKNTKGYLAKKKDKIAADNSGSPRRT